MIYGSDYTKAMNKARRAWGELLAGGFFGGFEAEYDLPQVEAAFLDASIIETEAGYQYAEPSTETLNRILEAANTL